LLIISKDKITEIFCSIDDFCKVFEPALTKKLISDENYRSTLAKI